MVRRIIYLSPGFPFVSSCISLRCEYVVAKKGFFAIENPTSTILWLYKPMEASYPSSCLCAVQCQKFLKRRNGFAVTVPLGQYGAMTERLSCKECKAV